MSAVANVTEDFHQISRNIVEKFLQSVVVVDDRAFINKEEAPKPLENAPGRIKKEAVKPLESATAEETVKEQAALESLNAKELIDSFAEKGLVCAVIKPEDKGENKNLVPKTERAAHRADIIILDWQIGVETSYGDKAVELIKAITAADETEKNPASPHRLRLIVIYTSNPDTAAIIEKLKKQVGINNAQVNEFEIINKALKIVVYKKAGGITKKDTDRIVNENELTDRLITDFTNMTQGLLSNAALKSLGALRENTHRILSKFNPSLDASYISHRGLTNPPEEAQTHPISLISSEFNDVLEDCGVTDCVSPNIIKTWIDTLINNQILVDGKVAGMTAQEVNSAIIDLMENGLEAEKNAGIKPTGWISILQALDGADKDKLNELTKILINVNADAKDNDADFAILTNLKSGYSNPDPMLKLGSILRKNASDYFICIQPLCDSVRLTGKKFFPFLKLRVNKKVFDIVLQYGKNKVYLKVDYIPSNLVQINFKPASPHKEVRAVKDTPSAPFFYYSEETDPQGKPIRYESVAELKYPHAQRIINDFAYKFSRVGLMESDWLRRMARNSSLE